ELQLGFLKAAAFALTWILVAQAGAAPTVTTDAAEYAAGDVAIITGVGWEPGEVVALEISQDPELHTADVLYALADLVIADELGNIHSGYVVPGHDVAQIFTLTATGESLGLTAQSWFTNDLDFTSIPVPPMSSTEPTVATDFPDYFPRETVVITGSGWEPGETVALEIVEDPISHPAELLHAIADDPGGNILAGYVVDDHDLGHTFTLTATGQTSGLTAQTTFTDAACGNGNCQGPSQGEQCD